MREIIKVTAALTEFIYLFIFYGENLYLDLVSWTQFR